VGHVQKRSNGRYKARYRAVDGKERSRTFDRKVEAQRWLTTETADLARGNWTDPGLGRMTFDLGRQVLEAKGH
jgi:hypothetical protein